MATIKSHTDLSQSKTLSKILPHESADMLWGYWYNGENHCVPNMRPFRDLRDNIPNGYIPAWSLAALLDALPDRICLDNEKYYLNYKKDKVEYLGPLTWDGQKCITSKANTLVDVCYEMILKLHELNLL